MGFLATLCVAYLLRLQLLATALLLIWVLLFYYGTPSRSGPGVRSWALRALIAGSLGYLAVWKYLPALAPLAWAGPVLVGWAAPLGISYFTFKFIHYAVERRRGNIAPHGFSDFLSYIVLVPIFSAGPIERFDHFLANRERSWRAQSAAEGLTRIGHGLIKKFLVANLLVLPLLASVRDGGELLDQLSELPTWKVWAFCIRSFLYLYLDFSAYSDIAIGASRLFGLRILENFNWPILAGNIREFWTRWHMTLAGWCQSYVYMPAIGRTRNPHLATYATFIAIGLWHSASLGWIAWGLYHATGISLYGTWTRQRRRRKWRGLDRPGWRWIGVGATFAFVSAGAAFTAIDAYGGWFEMMRVCAKLLFINLPA